MAVAAALVALVGEDAEAGRKRRPRGRKNHRFLTAKAPDKGRTPETNDQGAPAGADRDVAGAAFAGDGRMQVLSGGVSIVLSPNRALVANPYRGLCVIDTTDPDAPAILGSVALGADRLFVEGSTALVVLSRSDGTTSVTAVDLADESNPTAGESVSIDGSLTDAIRVGSDLIVVTGSWAYAYDYMTGGGGMMDGPASMGGMGPRKGRGAMADEIAPDFWFPWGTSKVRVARVSVAGGDLELLGTYGTDGSLAAHDVDGDRVALIVDRTQWYYAYEGDGSGQAADYGPKLLDVDASGAPALVGETAVTDLYGFAGLDLSDSVARLVGWTSLGMRASTYSFGSGDPSLLDTYDLPAGYAATAFVGDRLVFAQSGDFYFEPKPGEPKPDDPTTGGPSNGGYRATFDGAVIPLSATVSAIDLSDPSDLQSLGTTEVGEGYVWSIHAAADDAVVVIGSYDTPSVRLARVDLATGVDVIAGEDVAGSFWNAQPVGDLLLLSGGEVGENGAYAPQTLPVSLADGGLVVGGAIPNETWCASAAYSDPILALASPERVALFDLSDLANPVARGTVQMAVNVADLVVLGADTAVCLVADWVAGEIELRSVSLPDADALQPLDTLTVGTGDARLFRDGSMLYVLATDWSDGSGRLTVVDANDPSDLRERGTLELSSYPGQAFLVNGALVLLREAWSLVEFDEASGRTRGMRDGFGRSYPSWTRDDLGAVLDIVDLSNPDAPRAALRRRIRWDWGGEAVLRGTTLYVPSYTTYGYADDGWERTVYAVRAIELANPLDPRIRGNVTVPGTLVGAADGSGRVLTVSYDYERTDGSFHATLNLCDLRSDTWQSRVVASRELNGTVGAVVAGDTHAYVATEDWNWEDATVTYALGAFDLTDLAEGSSQARERSAWGGTVAGGHLFLRTWGWSGAVDAYSLADPASPSFVTSADVDGVGTHISVAGGRAYVPAGYHGVFGFDLE